MKKQLPTRYLDIARRGDMARLRNLIEHEPALLNKRGPFNRTFLWEAARAGQLEAIEYLLAAGSQVNATGAYNNESMVQLTPFCVAHYYRRNQVADLLWQHGSTLDIFRAAFMGDADLVQRFLAADPALLTAEDPEDATYFMPLLAFAVVGGHVALCDQLIHQGAPVRPYSALLIHLAARSTGMDLLNLLGSRGALFSAVGAGIFASVTRLDTLEYLIRAGVSVDGLSDDAQPPLAHVARADKGTRPDKLRLLLDHGADVNAAGRDGRTALHYAAAAGRTEAVQLLLDRGAHATALDHAGYTPLDRAHRAGKEAVALTRR
jgi:ankyrin repeat protein